MELSRLRTLLPSRRQTRPKQYGMFEGVFKPTLLTILGAIMYLRMGWVVGNAGLLGGVVVVLLAVSITLATGLSVSSIATNTRLKAGGPYAMISKSLGLEVGGAVGLPLFLSQAFAVAMYIFGFREGWQRLFPEHSAFLIDVTVFAVVFVVAYISASLAFRLQYLVLILIGVSLISVFSSPLTWSSTQTIHWFGTFSATNWWGVFAVFFPATTGIMSGVNMSGELKNSRHSIPRGTLGAIAVSTCIYITLCWWVARAASPAELVENYTIMVDHARWGPAVLGGLLAATFSAALSSLVGAPRILMALSRDGVIPKGKWLGQLSANGEPRRALVASGILVFGALLFRDLNAIATLITMFFLITYACLNFTVLVESSLGLMNFRPTFKLHRLVPLYGVVSCLFAMLVIDPRFCFWASVTVVIIYFRLAGQPHEQCRPADARSGVLGAIAQWAATKVVDLDMTNVRAWRPTLLVPIQDKSQLLGEFSLLINLCQPEGAIELVGLATQVSVADLSHQLHDLSGAFRRRGGGGGGGGGHFHHLFCACSELECDGYARGTSGVAKCLFPAQCFVSTGT